METVLCVVSLAFIMSKIYPNDLDNRAEDSIIMSIFLIAAYLWAKRVRNCRRTKFLCVPVTSCYLSRRELTEHMKTQEFHEVPGIDPLYLTESEHWFRLRGQYIPKSMVADVGYVSAGMTTGPRTSAIITFADGREVYVYVGDTRAKGADEAYDAFKRMAPCTQLLNLQFTSISQEMRRQFKRLLLEYLEEDGEDRMKLVEKRDILHHLRPYCIRQAAKSAYTVEEELKKWDKQQNQGEK